MSRYKFLWLLIAAGCADRPDVGTPPSSTPRPPWGVPITGGTMLVTRDGRYAVVADPDRDRIATVELATRSVVADIALVAGDEPGRLVEDGAGRIHVALRRGSAVVTLASATSGAGLVRRPVCGEPRGVAYEAASDLVHVACTGGELVSLAASGGDPVRRLQLDRDLRDVVVIGDELKVTRFRTAEVLTLDHAGAVVDREVPPTVHRPGGFGPGPVDPATGAPLPVDATPDVAWRTIALPDGRLVMSHQRHSPLPLGTSTAGYSGSCSPPVESAITVMQPGAAPFAVAPFGDVLPVDIAVSPDGGHLAVVSATTGVAIRLVSVADTAVLAAPDGGNCGPGAPSELHSGFLAQLGAPTSVAFTRDDALLVLYPEVPAIVVASPPYSAVTETIQLPGELGYDAGRELFHRETGAQIACASCHPEGRDDGQVWNFDNIGLRRTQSVAGHILSRAPYHWSGDLTDLAQLMDQVFTQRMSGGAVTANQVHVLGLWLDRIPAPAPPPTSAPAAVARGKALFEAPDVGCATCHAGALLTNDQRVDVHTGGVFKVPSLVGIAARPPYLHDGCAATLAERFGECGGGDAHGHTSGLSVAQLADLTAYLESL